MSDKQVEFKGRAARCVYSSPDFKTYAMDVNKDEYPDIKQNKYKNVSIIGNISDLTLGVEYEITATEEESKYGTSYRVTNIRRNVPTTAADTKIFLEEILTANQADVLYEEYPNIIDIVKNNRCDKVDLNKLHGIGEKTFEVIKNKIIENFKLADLVAEFKGTVSLSMLKKIYDKYSDLDVLREKLKTEPYKTLTRISGVGFKTADSLILDLQKDSIVDFGYDVKTSEDRCLACIIYLLQENENNGNTRANLADIRSQCIEMIPSSVKHFANAIQDDVIYYSKESMSIALKKTYEDELYIAKTIADNLHNASKNDDVWDYDVEKYHMVEGFALSDEQMRAVENVCKYSISILNGGAGCGKSFSTQAIINMLDDNKKRYILLTPTGKASKVLSEFTHRQASTIHRGLCYNPRTGWGYNKYNKLEHDVVIVDEFSMTDVSLCRHLFEAIDFEFTRLLIVGDNAQLPSVGCGNLLHDFMESNVIPTTTLTTVFRYNEGGLSKVATDTRFCKTYLDKSMKGKATSFGANKDYMFIDMPQEDIPRSAVSLYKKLYDSGVDVTDIQVLTAKNVGDYGTIALNNMIQRAVNPNYGSELCMKIGDTSYYKGDLIIEKKNNYKAILADCDNEQTAFVANGETAIVEYACKEHVILNFDGIRVTYGKSDMQMVGLGYAITSHKSQGSGIKNVIVCTPKADIFMLNSNLIYVALTRMKERCFHLGSVDTVNMAVKKKANLSRHTFMQGMLKSLVK